MCEIFGHRDHKEHRDFVLFVFFVAKTKEEGESR